MKKHTRNITLALLTAATVSTSHGAILALYDAEAGGVTGETDFNNAAFDSVDTELLTTAGSMVSGGGLDGGGSGQFVIDNAIFNPTTGTRGYNMANAETASQSAAQTAGDFFTFTMTSNGNNVTYESLSFYHDQFSVGGEAKVDVSYTIFGGSETFILADFTPVAGNAPVVLETVNFADFSSTSDVTFKFYLHSAKDSIQGTRFEDITLNGTVAAVPEPSSTALLGLGGLALILRRRRA